MKPTTIADLARDFHDLELTAADAERLAAELDRLNRTGAEPIAFDADPTVDFRLALRCGAGF